MTGLLVSCKFAPYCANERLAYLQGLPEWHTDARHHVSYAGDCWLGRPGQPRQLHPAARLYRESPDRQNAAAILEGRPPEVQLSHDTASVGHVASVAAGRDHWWHADMIIEDGPLFSLARERCHVGAAVSLGARVVTEKLGRDPIHHGRTCRIMRAELQHIAILHRGEHPGYEDAQITQVRELSAKPLPIPLVSDDWEKLSRDSGEIIQVR